jgi:hypothetical protein
LTHDTTWKKSSKSSGAGTECVEVRQYDGVVQVRDSKDPDGPVLAFSPEQWEAFVRAATDGEFDLGR